MLFTTPEQFVVLAVLLVVGWLLGYASAPNAKTWKRRARAQSDSFTTYYNELERKLRASETHADALQTRNDALAAERVDLERTIASLRAAVPVVVEAHRPVVAEPEVEPEAHPEPEPAEPIATYAAVEPVKEVAHEAPEGGPLEPVATFPVIAADVAPATETVAATDAPRAAADETVVTPQAPLAVEIISAPIGPAEPAMPSKGWFPGSARDDLTRLRGIDRVLDTRLFALGVTRFEDIEKLSAEDEMALEQRLDLPVGYVGREQWRTQAALLRAGRTEEHAAHFGAEPVA